MHHGRALMCTAAWSTALSPEKAVYSVLYGAIDLEVLGEDPCWLFVLALRMSLAALQGAPCFFIATS